MQRPRAKLGCQQLPERGEAGPTPVDSGPATIKSKPVDTSSAMNPSANTQIWTNNDFVGTFGIGMVAWRVGWGGMDLDAGLGQILRHLEHLWVAF